MLDKCCALSDDQALQLFFHFASHSQSVCTKQIPREHAVTAGARRTGASRGGPARPPTCDFPSWGRSGTLLASAGGPAASLLPTLRHPSPWDTSPPAQQSPRAGSNIWGCSGRHPPHPCFQACAPGLTPSRGGCTSRAAHAGRNLFPCRLTSSFLAASAARGLSSGRRDARALPGAFAAAPGRSRSWGSRGGPRAAQASRPATWASCSSCHSKMKPNEQDFLKRLKYLMNKCSAPAGPWQLLPAAVPPPRSHPGELQRLRSECQILQGLVQVKG